MKKGFKIAMCTVGGMVVMGLMVAVIMWLWNLVVPAITGWSAIGFWQALGLAVLFRLLTGHIATPFSSRKGHRHLHEKMHMMTVAQRKEFIREKLDRLSTEEMADEK